MKFSKINRGQADHLCYATCILKQSLLCKSSLFINLVYCLEKKYNP